MKLVVVLENNLIIISKNRTPRVNDKKTNKKTMSGLVSLLIWIILPSSFYIEHRVQKSRLFVKSQDIFDVQNIILASCSARKANRVIWKQSLRQEL